MPVSMIDVGSADGTLDLSAIGTPIAVCQALKTRVTRTLSRGNRVTARSVQ